MDLLIPKPVSIKRGEGAFVMPTAITVAIASDTAEVRGVAAELAALLRSAAGGNVTIHSSEDGAGQITLRLLQPGTGNSSQLGGEGYYLRIAPDGIVLEAVQPAGLFHGVQTLRQLLPPPGKGHTGVTVPAGEIVDYPRFAWRGAMLDVARHFFAVEDVKRYIDLLAQYKMNVLHLHLSDDQGWRIEIKSWPKLTEVGGSTAVNGEGGGYYTQAQYADLVAYAAEHFITIVPEIDLPSHTNAALASYAELNCDGVAQPLYTGTNVGFSSLCVDKEVTYMFLDDVLRELAELTPGPYLHIGGDEAMSTPPDAYLRFMERVQPIVEKYGKKVVGWEELGQARLLPGTLVQQWNTDPARTVHTLQAVEQGAKVIVSPASHTYLDMKYHADTPLGLQWAALVEVRDAYDWEPTNYLAGVGEAQVIGVEAPLWSETLRTLTDIEYMVMPRMPGIAEIGWSPAHGRSWDEYRTRLAAQAPRWDAMGVTYYRSTQVDWP
ncbi:MAG: beta-N-acetylhexosaminidase [Caldilineaceae bacterium]